MVGERGRAYAERPTGTACWLAMYVNPTEESLELRLHRKLNPKLWTREGALRDAALGNCASDRTEVVAREYYNLAPYATGQSYDDLSEESKELTYRPAARKIMAAMRELESDRILREQEEDSAMKRGDKLIVSCEDVQELADKVSRGLVDERAYQRVFNAETDPFVKRLFRGVVEAYEEARTSESSVMGDVSLRKDEAESVDAATADHPQPQKREIRLLKPCPFCGNEPYDTVGGMPEGYGVVCPHCDYRGPEDITEERAVERWNSRAAEPVSGSPVSLAKCKWELSKVFVPDGIWNIEEGMKMERAAKAMLDAAGVKYVN